MWLERLDVRVVVVRRFRAVADASACSKAGPIPCRSPEIVRQLIDNRVDYRVRNFGVQHTHSRRRGMTAAARHFLAAAGHITTTTRHLLAAARHRVRHYAGGASSTAASAAAVKREGAKPARRRTTRTRERFFAWVAFSRFSFRISSMVKAAIHQAADKICFSPQTTNEEKCFPLLALLGVERIFRPAGHRKP